MKIPASIYDLPGLGGIETEEQLSFVRTVFEKTVAEVDYIIYVSSAERSLGDLELQMLRYIGASKKAPLLFVITKADLYEQKVHEVMHANRRYFDEYFDGFDSFVEEGILDVSAAYEADAQLSETASDYEELVNASKMPLLRKKLLDHLMIYSSPTHINGVITKLTPILKHLGETIKRHRLAVEKPIEEIKEALSLLDLEYGRLIKFQHETRIRLDERIGIAASTPFRENDEENLCLYLTKELGPDIEKYDVLSERGIHEIERKRDKLIMRWQSENNGLVSRCHDALSRYKDYAISLIKDHEANFLKANLANTALLKPEQNGGIDKPDVFIEGQTEVTAELVSNTVAFIGSAALASSGAAVATIFAVAAPVGVAVAVMGVGVGVYRLFRVNGRRKEFREYLIREAIPQWSKTSIAFIEKNLEKNLQIYRNYIISIIDDAIAQNLGDQRTYNNALKYERADDTEFLKSIRKLEESYMKTAHEISVLFTQKLPSA